MKVSKIIGITIASLVFLSCESVPYEESTANNFAANSVTDTIQEEAEVAIASIKTIPPENTDFIARMQNVSMKIVSQPSATTKNKAFNAPYVVSVIKDGNPAPNFSVTAIYPQSRDNDEISFAREILTTDKDGNISFNPSAPTFAADSEITFYPTPINSDEDVVVSAINSGVSAKWKVRTNHTARQSMIYMFDYDAKGRAASNSFAMLQSLRNSGFAIGNGPISDASYLERPVEDLYKATKNMVGNSFDLLISGSIKYASPISKVTDGYSCTLVTDVTCISMADGSVIYKTQKEHTEIARNEYEALSQCRTALASKVTNILLYTL